jgi:hypothetical protein
MAKKNSSLNQYQFNAPDQSILLNSHLNEEYEARQALYDAQPALVQRFLEAQAAQLADAISRNQPQARFSLPDQVVTAAMGKNGPAAARVPSEYREQMVGGVIDRLTRADARTLLRTRLIELEEIDQPAVAIAASLMRHAVASHLVHNMLPAGRSVSYQAVEGEAIPTVPVENADEPGSAITAETDAIAEEGSPEENRGELLVPFVPAARRFYLPQWVAFDDECRLLLGSINEAEAAVASMQRFLAILHMAVGLAPYFVFDPDYRQKRYGMLGQLVNQGRKLAEYEVHEMIQTIKQRAAANDLNRGLSLTIPYFDDQNLVLASRDFVVIPGGRIMFVPAFVVQAVREEQVKVAQDTRLSPSTRNHLLAELQIFEAAFYHAPKPQ